MLARCCPGERAGSTLFAGAVGTNAADREAPIVAKYVHLEGTMRSSLPEGSLFEPICGDDVLGVLCRLATSADSTGLSPIAGLAMARSDLARSLVKRVSSDLGSEDLAALSDLPIHLAVQIGRPDAAALLLLWGADPCARDSAGRTALHYAALHSRDPVLFASVVDVCLRKSPLGPETLASVLDDCTSNAPLRLLIEERLSPAATAGPRPPPAEIINPTSPDTAQSSSGCDTPPGSPVLRPATPSTTPSPLRSVGPGDDLNMSSLSLSSRSITDA